MLKVLFFVGAIIGVGAVFEFPIVDDSVGCDVVGEEVVVFIG